MFRRTVARGSGSRRRDVANDSQVSGREPITFERAIDDFYDVTNDVRRSLSETLYRESTRAKTICEVLEMGLSAFIKALSALGAEELDAKLERELSANPRGDGNQRLSHDAMKQVEVVQERICQEQEVGGFGGALQHSTKSDAREEQHFVAFFTDIRFVLRQRTIVKFVKALDYWCKAYEAEQKILKLYATNSRLIWDLQKDADELEKKVSSARSDRKHSRDTETITSATARMSQIRKEAHAMQLSRQDRAIISAAERDIRKAMNDMKVLRKKVDSDRRYPDIRKEYMARRKTRINLPTLGLGGRRRDEGSVRRRNDRIEKLTYYG